MLDPDAVAARTFGTSFRGYDTGQVRRFLLEVSQEVRSLASGVIEGIDDERATMLLGEEAGRLLGAARASAAAVVAKAEERAAEVLREAQDEAVRLRATVEGERERAYAEGAARAEEVLAEAERTRDAADQAAHAEAERLLAEAMAAREHVLGDLARRRKTVRAQVEQLHAAREKLLGSLADVGRFIEEARGRLVVALPEAKQAADAAARRATEEAEATIEQLESELEAFRLVGIPLGAAADEPVAAEVVEVASVEVEVEAEVAESGPVEGRKSTSVRVFRSRRDAAPAIGLPEAELHEVEPADPVEEVRVLPVDEAAAPEAAAEEATSDVDVDEGVTETKAVVADADDETVVPPVEAEVLAEDVSADEAVADEEAEAPLEVGTVDALFARLRAGREARIAAAETVLAPESEPAAEPPVDVEAEVEVEAAPTGALIDEVAIHVGGGGERDELLARRDELLAGPVAALLRRFKRLLADEQNAVLDALRRSGVAAGAVPAQDDLEARWADAALADLTAAAAAGGEFLGRDDVDAPPLHDVAADLAAAVAGPLAERLVAAVERSDGDHDLAADGVRSACREWRARRLGDGVEHAVRVAFGRGALAAAEATGQRVCWVVDDGGAPCPDAEDNALAGVLAAGESFPTGHRHPPAHPGCRCVLATSS